MPNDGWVKLWRKSLDGDMIKNHSLWIFWTWCLLKASHKKHKQLIGYQEIWLEPGQFVFGRSKAAEETGLSEQTIRTCIKSLKSTGNVTSKVTSKFTVITIANWTYYQSSEDESTSKVTSKSTNDQPATNQQLTTNKNVKKGKKGKKSTKITTKENTLSLENRKRLKVYFDELEKQEKELKRKKDRERKKFLFDSFDDFWRTYPGTKTAKKKCREKWLMINPNQILFDKITEAIINQQTWRAKAKPEDFRPPWKNPHTWLHNECWNDETTEDEIKTPPPQPEFPKQLSCKFCNQACIIPSPATQCARCGEPFYNKLLESDGTRKRNIPTKEDLITCAKCSYSWSYKACYTRICPNCGINNRKNGQTDSNLQHKKNGVFAYESTYSDQLSEEAEAEASEIKVMADGLLRSVPALTKEEKEGLDE